MESVHNYVVWQQQSFFSSYNIFRDVSDCQWTSYDIIILLLYLNHHGLNFCECTTVLQNIYVTV